MTKKISGSEYQLSKIFSSDFDYIIPTYQRPYAWTTDETSELLDDLIDFHANEKEDGYFLGSIVLIKEENAPHSEVIDGQQRLTTLTILLAVLADQIDDIYRSEIIKYIQEPGSTFEGLAPKPRLSLRERDKNFFAKYIQGLELDELMGLNTKSLDNEAKQNIQKNCEYLRNRISELKSSNKFDLQAFVSFLISRCYIVAVSTPSQQSAFRVFSVMNSRGLDLQPTDIIKADVIGNIGDDGKRTHYSDLWEEMETELSRSGFNDLFTYIRMIFAKEKSKRALLEEFRKHVLTNHSDPEQLIENILQPYSNILLVLKTCSYQSTTDSGKINEHLKWLNRIDNSDWIPPAMSFLFKYENDQDSVIWFFERLERLAAYMHICGKNINQRIERYASLLYDIENQNRSTTDVLTADLTDIEKIEFYEALQSDIYRLTARRRNYLILRLDSFVSDGAASYDSSILTIEHVLPQTVDDQSEWAQLWPCVEDREEWTHKLANLVPLNKRRNSTAQNFDFEKKKSAYFSGGKNVSSYALTSQVLATETWDMTTLQNRQKDLLAVLSKNWRLT